MEAKYALVGLGLLGLTLLPIFKCGQESGLNAIQILYRHTIFAPEPNTLMAEKPVRELCERNGIRLERGTY